MQTLCGAVAEVVEDLDVARRELGDELRLADRLEVLRTWLSVARAGALRSGERPLGLASWRRLDALDSVAVDLLRDASSTAQVAEDQRQSSALASLVEALESSATAGRRLAELVLQQSAYVGSTVRSDYREVAAVRILENALVHPDSRHLCFESVWTYGSFAAHWRSRQRTSEPPLPTSRLLGVAQGILGVQQRWLERVRSCRPLRA